MKFTVAVLGGDGVGPEVTAQALKVVSAAAQRFGHEVELLERPFGWSGYREVGHSLPPETVETCRASDAVLVGACGGPPELAQPPMGSGLTELRRALAVACNFRPIKLFPPLIDVGPVRREYKEHGIDFVIARDIAAPGGYGPGGLEHTSAGRVSTSTFSYSDTEVERVIRPSFELASTRRNRIHLVGYWEHVGFSKIWRIVFDEVAEDYPDVERVYMLPDNCNQLIVKDPSQFDVVLFDDLYRAGMIVDLAAAVVGSLGLAPSAAMRPQVDADGRTIGSLERVFGFYEPSHGTVDHRAGKDEVDPIAAIMSAAFMFRYSFDLPEAADEIERAVVRTIARGFRTYDIMADGTTLVGCSEMGDRIAEEVTAPREPARA